MRDDDWGGSFANRIRFAVETVRRTRAAVGDDFIVIFRLSMLDLVEGGSTWDEVVELARAVEDAGATMINTGIGWHEARIPTIATMVPRAAFAWVTRRLKGKVRVPLVTTNRINDPADVEAILARGDADMVSMARPFLADPGLRRQGARRPRRRDQHLHRLQPGLPRPHLRAQDRVLPRQPGGVPRSRVRARARDRAQARRRRRRGTGGTRLRDDRRRARTRGHAVSTRRARSAASSTSRSASPARRSSRRPCATSARGSRSSA